MSFCIWEELPPFTPDPPEYIYRVGDKFVVTDQGKPSQNDIDQVLSIKPAKRLDFDVVVDEIKTKKRLPKSVATAQ